MTLEYIKNNRGHTWQLDEEGKVDIFGHDIGMHNGPKCATCGYSFCHHCSDLPQIECGSPCIPKKNLKARKGKK